MDAFYFEKNKHLRTQLFMYLYYLIFVEIIHGLQSHYFTISDCRMWVLFLISFVR
jgi:hypothetical protein